MKAQTLNKDSLFPFKESTLSSTMKSNYHHWLKAGYGDKQIEIFPGIQCNSDRFRNMRAEIGEALKTVFRNAKDNPCFDGYQTCFQDWTQPTSLNMGPLSNNSSLRALLGLRNNIKQYEVEILTWLLDEIFENIKPETIHLNAVSHSGPPFFIRGSEYKKMVADKINKYPEAFLKGLAELDSKTLLEFDCLPAFSSGIRVQGDSFTLDINGYPVPKQRNYPRVEDVLEGNNKLEAFSSPDYTVYYENGQVDKRFISGRSRLMYATSYPVNYLLQIINKMCMRSFKRLDCKTYSGPDALFEVYQNRATTNFVALDCANFGETFHPYVIERFIDYCDNYFGSLTASAIEQTFDLPSMVNSLVKNRELEPFVTRPFFTPETEENHLRSSFKSGHGLVAFMGSLEGVWMCLSMLYEAGFEDYKRIAKGNHPDVSFNNTGDDSLFAFRKRKDAKIFNERIKRYECGKEKPLFKISVEEPTKYLGYIYTETGVGLLSSVLIERLLSTERGWRNKEYHGYGHQIRYYEFKQRNPMAEEIYRIITYYYKKRFDFDLMKYILDAESPDLLLNEADTLFLTDPAYFHYKIEEELLNPELLMQFYRSMSPEEQAPLLEVMNLK